MRLLLLAIALFLATPVHAVEPSEMLANPVLEARARAISKGLRCLVCRNETIDDSNAGIAHDLRVLLRQRLLAGDTDAQAVAFIVARYGDFVLLKPPFKPVTLLLWGGPPALLILAALGFLRVARRRPAETPEPLTEADRAAVAHILAKVEAE